MSVAEILSKYTDPSNPSNLTGVPVDVLMSLINGEGSKKVKKSKKEKDPKKPKRPLNACFQWMADGNRDRIKEELKSSGKSCKMPDVTREAGRQWKELSEDMKKSYVDSAASALVAYKEAMCEYKPVVTSSSVSDELPKGGELGYSELYENKYLRGYVKGEDGKKIVFSDLDTAIRASFDIEDCGGVTAEKGKKSWRYTLRMGGAEDMKDSRKGEGSWVKLNGGAPAKLESCKPEKESEPVPEECNIDDRHVEGAYLSGAGIPDGIDEEEFVEKESDDGSDEECEVEEFEWNGKTYVYDEDGNIYDPEGDGDVIGKYVDGVPQW